jgi:hypothetical protein
MISVVMRDGIDHRKMERDFTFDRISPQIERILFSIEFVASHRYGVTMGMLHQAQKDRFGTCHKTARRDISVLVAVGLLVIADRKERHNIFKLNPSMRLGQLLLSVSNQSMEGSVQHA